MPGVIPLVLTIVGVTQIASGVLAFVAPGAFYDLVAGYPPENDHFLKDIGSWSVALGAVALYAARRPNWHVPLLGFLALQYVLHTVSHIIDVSQSDPDWHGPVGLVTQAFGAIVLTALFLRERAGAGTGVDR